MNQVLKNKKFDSIQFAQWGMQDAVLSILFDAYANKKSLHTYSTDQCLNGFFYSKYDLVGIQGIKEQYYIDRYQALNFEKYFINNVRKEKIDKYLEHAKHKNKNTILICGAHKNFYPRSDELNKVKHILDKSDLLKEFKIIYRPLINSIEDLIEIEKKLEGYLNDPNFIVSTPSEALTGLENLNDAHSYEDVEYEESKYFDLLYECKSVIAFIATSLLIDAERMGAYVCSYINTDHVFHKNTGTELMFLKNSINIYEGIEVYTNIENMIISIQTKKYSKVNSGLAKNW